MPQGVADLMHDAALHGRMGEHRLDRIVEALEVIGAGDQHILDAALLQITEHNGRGSFI
jgi:hypothetical protein